MLMIDQVSGAKIYILLCLLFFVESIQCLETSLPKLKNDARKNFENLCKNLDKWNLEDFKIWFGLVQNKRFLKYAEKVTKLIESIDSISDDEEEEDEKQETSMI